MTGFTVRSCGLISENILMCSSCVGVIFMSTRVVDLLLIYNIFPFHQYFLFSQIYTFETVEVLCIACFSSFGEVGELPRRVGGGAEGVSAGGDGRRLPVTRDRHSPAPSLIVAWRAVLPAHVIKEHYSTLYIPGPSRWKHRKSITETNLVEGGVWSSLDFTNSKTIVQYNTKGKIQYTYFTKLWLLATAEAGQQSLNPSTYFLRFFSQTNVIGNFNQVSMLDYHHQPCAPHSYVFARSSFDKLIDLMSPPVGQHQK